LVIRLYFIQKLMREYKRMIIAFQPIDKTQKALLVFPKHIPSICITHKRRIPVKPTARVGSFVFGRLVKISWI
jgi:hypothetical protein